MPLAVFEKSFKKFLYQDAEADDFQHLISSSLSTDKSVVKFSRRSVQQFLHKVANKQTKGITSKLLRLFYGL